mgnify:CR=1 FL=1|jgi:uncharacterized protein (TIGR01319 family)
MTVKSKYATLIDFGSTYTKVVVVDLENKQLIKVAQFASTVSFDARIGLQQCFNAAIEAIGEEKFEKSIKLSSSSAAGGLRMGVVGLSKSLSLEAGRNASFGAGAKILATFNGKLTDYDINNLTNLPLEILLFCGGYEDGNTNVMLHNAQMLANSTIHVPIIYAGNSQISTSVRSLFTLNNKEFYVVSNIIPSVGVLDSYHVESIIREVFLKRIINMKGLDKVTNMLDRVVMPTPAAVLQGGELLSRGTANYKGLGNIMIVDVGGATTDIHSYSENISYDGAKLVGIDEPYRKRTVEGDLGLRESSNSLIKEIGIQNFINEVAYSIDDVNKVINKWITKNKELATSKIEVKVDQALAKGAVRISARRHAGWIEHISSSGLKAIQHGKNLTEIKKIIGTGGPIIYSREPKEILSQVIRSRNKEPDVLLPEHSTFYLDKDYVLFAGGLLNEVDKDIAFLLMKNSLIKI